MQKYVNVKYFLYAAESVSGRKLRLVISRTQIDPINIYYF